MSKALVLGCGASGLACVRFLVRRGWDVSVADTREAPAGLAELRRDFPSIRFTGGDLPDSLIQDCDIVVLSPGLSPEHSMAAKLVSRAKKEGKEILGEIELFARELARLKETKGYEPKIVGITGTNGKTTTTRLVGLMAQEAGRSVCVAGNIGPNAVTELDRLNDGGELPSFWVLELSSFQLATTQSLKASAAAFLNLTQDHVDWHGSMAEYEAAKRRIFSQGTVRILNRDDAASMRAAEEAASIRTFGVSEPKLPGEYGLVRDAGIEWLCEIPPQAEGLPRRRSLLLAADPAERRLLMPVDSLKIRGRHNAMNALAAIALAEAVGLPLSAALRTLSKFPGEAHRVQFVLKTASGVEFIDDSKGTNVGATCAALCGLGASGQKCSLILGGDSKGQDFSDISEAVAAYARSVVLIGRDADRIKPAVSGLGVPVQNAGFDFEKAIELAYEAAHKGDAVLLSPACASWDMFKNYAERASRFIVKAKEIALREDQAE